MPIFGFNSVGDMFDGGGAGASGGGGGGNLLSGIGSLLGGIVGGPIGAALGAGLGTLAGGGNINSALQAGASNFVLGKVGGPGANLLSALGGGGTPEQFLQNLTGTGPGAAPQGQGQPGKPQGPMGGILSVLNSPLVMAALLKATEPDEVSLTSPAERRMLQTGERLPDYQGTPAFDYRYGSTFARGGIVNGPGHGTSDSIPAKIYQDGQPVREARLSDGEFVMTNRAVRGAGDGNRAKGAAEMYRMMRQLERRA